MKKTRPFLRRFIALSICLAMLFSMSLSFDANRLKAYAMSETSSESTEENIEIYFERSDGEIVKPDSDGKIYNKRILRHSIFSMHIR